VNLSVKVDTRDLEDKLYLLAREARLAPGRIIQEETKGITQQIIRITPPRNLAQGRKAVERDIGRVVTGLPNLTGGPAFDAVNRAAVAKNEALVNRLLGRWKSKPTFTSVPAAIKGEHLRKRTRYGRVRARAQLMTYARDAKRYLREVQSRVGWAKGAWVSALIAAGGRAPSWIMRHAAKSGSVVANFGENPRVLAIAHNIKIPGYQRMVDAAVRTRERITQRKIDRLIAGKGVNLGFVVFLDRN